MKIIRKGREQKYPVNGTCEECGCVFEFRKSDVHEGWGGSPVAYVKCPQCGFKCDVVPDWHLFNSDPQE